jgi:hypothetical protein
MVSELNKLGFSKLLDAMRKLSIDVNDREICKKLETLMLTSKDDLNIISIKQLLQTPSDFDPKDVPDPYTQYVKHFIYMVKRNDKMGSQVHVYEEDDLSKRIDKKK